MVLEIIYLAFYYYIKVAHDIHKKTFIGCQNDVKTFIRDSKRGVKLPGRRSKYYWCQPYIAKYALLRIVISKTFIRDSKRGIRLPGRSLECY